MHHFCSGLSQQNSDLQFSWTAIEIIPYNRMIEASEETEADLVKEIVAFQESVLTRLCGKTELIYYIKKMYSCVLCLMETSKSIGVQLWHDSMDTLPGG